MAEEPLVGERRAHRQPQGQRAGAGPSRRPNRERARWRRAVGVRSHTARTVSLNWRMLEKPAANATSLNGNSVVSMSTRAVCVRCALASASGSAPTSACSRRSSWRVVYPTRAARPVTPSRSTVPSVMSRMALATTSPRTFHSGDPGEASGRQRLQARKPAFCAAAAVG